MYWWDRGAGTKVTRSRAARIRDPDSVLWKPDGGLWAAPRLSADAAPSTEATRGFHTTWTAYQAEFKVGTGRLTELVPSASAVVVCLKTEDDVRAACARWPRTVEVDAEIGLPRTIRGFSFEAMLREGVHAVHVSGEALGDDLLYGWDVESTVWLDPGKVEAGERASVAWDQPDDGLGDWGGETWDSELASDEAVEVARRAIEQRRAEQQLEADNRHRVAEIERLRIELAELRRAR